MVRIKRGNIAAKRRKKYFNLAKGFRGSNSKLSTMIGEQLVQSFYHAYIGRKLKKRNFRSIWISRINAVSRSRHNNYSRFMGILRKKDIYINRKILSLIAFYDILSFNILERKCTIV